MIGPGAHPQAEGAGPYLVAWLGTDGLLSRPPHWASAAQYGSGTTGSAQESSWIARSHLFDPVRRARSMPDPPVITGAWREASGNRRAFALVNVLQLSD